MNDPAACRRVIHLLTTASIQTGFSPRPVAAYRGDYENEIYGRVTISLEGDPLVLRLSSHLIGDMADWHYETFPAMLRDRAAEATMGRPSPPSGRMLRGRCPL